MANEAFAWLIRFKDIERDYRVTRLATDLLLQSLQTGAANLEGDLKILGIHRASKRFEGTYIANLFSEFERGLKRFLHAQKLKKMPRHAEPLINRVAARAGIAAQHVGNHSFPIPARQGPCAGRGNRRLEDRTRQRSHGA